MRLRDYLTDSIDTLVMRDNDTATIEAIHPKLVDIHGMVSVAISSISTSVTIMPLL